jgi:parallel beta-helix repeat protein
MRLHWLYAAPLLLCGPVSAATYTVAPNGSDGADGTSAPFRTLQRAVDALRDGDTILLRSGTYAAGVWIEQRNVTIRGEGTVVLDGANAPRDNGITFYQTGGVTVENVAVRNCRRMGLFCVLSDGLTVRNCTFSGNAGSGVLTGNTHNVLVESCVATGNTGHGVYLSQSGDRLRVLRCTLSNNQRAGLQINAVEESRGSTNPSTDSVSEDCLVEGNTVFGNGALGGSAIQLMSVRRSLVANNLVHSNLAGGISLWDDGAGTAYGCKDNRIVHNTVVFQSGRGRYGVQVTRGSTGNRVMNNILVCGNGPALEAAEAVESNYNCFLGPTSVNGGGLAAWQRSSGNDLNSQEGDPGLAADYRPADGSAARDGAVQVLDHDKDGRLRPQGPNPDVGCYEAGAGGTVPPPSPPPPAAGAAVIYGDALAPGWQASRVRASYALALNRPVAQGSRSMCIVIRGVDGYVQLAGPGIATSGRSHLKLLVNGGKAGGQELRVRALVDGQLQSFSLNLRNYGGLPQKKGWIEYAVPLADLQTGGRPLTGIRLFAGQKEPKVYLDWIRVE